MSIDQRKRIDYMTGLKGVAALAVSFNHFAGIFLCDYNFKNKWYCLFYNGTFMVYVFICLSSFFVVYNWFEKHDINKLGRDIFIRYFRISLPVFVFFIFISGFMQLGGYHFYDQAATILHCQRKEADALNYYSLYGMRDAVKVALQAVLVKETQFTFVIWMLPALFNSYMYSILLSLAIDFLKDWAKIPILFLAWLTIFYIRGGYGIDCSDFCCARSLLCIKQKGK